MIPLRATQIGASSQEQALAVGVTAFITGASTVIMGTLPLLVGLFAERLRLTWQEIGWLAVASQAGTLAGTLLAYGLIERGLLRRGIRGGAAVALVFSLLTSAAGTLPTLLWCLVSTSAGVGCVFAIGTYLLGRSALPTRNFCVMSGVQVVCGSVHAAILPWLTQHFGYVVAVSSVAFWFAAVLLVALRSRIPGSPGDSRSVRAARSSRPPIAGSALRLLGAVIAFQASVLVLWVYAERIGVASGLSPREIGTAIALGSLGGIPAAVVGALAGGRVGNIPILLLATLTVVCGELMIVNASAAQAYAAGQFIFNFGWMLGVSYYIGILAEQDSSGRVLRLAPPGLVIAGAIGPLSISLFTSGENAAPILAMSVALCIGAFVLATLRPASPHQKDGDELA